ncbi:MAG: V-type ATP synthase subunit A, partial [Clostridia bacterium]|nr:V-type ATP synthase subunit A [Clostridia bacterium]
VDTFASLNKQCTMLKLLLDAHDLALRAIDEDIEVDDILELPAREAISRSKYIEESNMAKFDELAKQMADEIESLISEGEL